MVVVAVGRARVVVVVVPRAPAQHPSARFPTEKTGRPVRTALSNLLAWRTAGRLAGFFPEPTAQQPPQFGQLLACLLYTSDAADERSSVDLGGRRIIKKKTRDMNEQSRPVAPSEDNASNALAYCRS